jgi:hypothetical protein
MAPAVVAAKAPAHSDDASAQPVQSAACTPHAQQDASNGNAAAVSAQPGEALLTSQCASPLQQP